MEPDIDFQNLGAKEVEPKVSDFALGAFITKEPIPETFGLDGYNIPPRHQKKQPSCGAHAGSEVKEILHKVSKGENVALSPRFLWKHIKDVDGFPISDGTTMQMIFKTLLEKGTCTLDLAPDTSEMPWEEYRNLKVTEAMVNDAVLRRTGNYAFSWYPSFEDIKQAIYEKKAVILLARIGKEWWTDKKGNFSYKAEDLLPLRTTEKISSGHFVVAYGYDKNRIYFYNHWGEGWCNGGTGYFEEEYTSRIIQMGAAVDASQFLFTKLLRRGSVGPEVSMLQLKLGGLVKDGVFGPKTEAAVKKFQAQHGLVADGIVGPKTREKLNV